MKKKVHFEKSQKVCMKNAVGKVFPFPSSEKKEQNILFV